MTKSTDVGITLADDLVRWDWALEVPMARGALFSAGEYSSEVDGAPVPSPDPRLDAVVDFVGRAAQDIQLLLAEVRRLRGG